MISSSAGACFRGGEIRGVAVNLENHVAGVVADNGIRVRSAVVQELGDGLECGMCSVGLLRGDGSNGSEHGGVNSPCIIEEGSKNFLDAFGIRGIKRGRGVGVGRILDLVAVAGFLPSMWRMLGFGRGGWENRCNARAMYPGMEMSHVRLS